MIKVEIKYIIYFFLFLFCGQSGLLQANAFTNAVSQTSLRKKSNSETASLLFSQEKEDAYIKSASSGTKNQSYLLILPFFENEESNEFSSNKKSLKNSSYSAITFLIVAPSYCYKYNTILLSNKYSANTLANKYLAFGVLRI